MMRLLTCLAAVLLPALVAQAGEWRGHLAAEFLGFPRDPLQPEQHSSYGSLALEPEFFHEWNDRDDLFTFKPYVLIDSHDDERSHADLRELSWIHAAPDWETNIGISKVYWGVTEAAHLVDVINQTDLVVNEDGEDKLGQPMAKLTLIRDWGILDLFVLPGFRERTFPGSEGRPRFSLPVSDDPVYESGAAQRHTDFAFRFSNSYGPYDVGISHFSGTGREPRFMIVPDNPAEVTPYYEIVDQTSIDLQAITGGWLWKLEAAVRSGQGKRIRSVAGGYEYTFVGVHDTAVDIGVITEYLYDSRGDTIDEEALASGQPFFTAAFQDELVLGARITLNDVASSELLASVAIDLEGGGESYNVEASRRLGDAWKLSLEARGLSHVPRDNIFYSFRDDTRVRVELARYF